MRPYREGHPDWQRICQQWSEITEAGIHFEVLDDSTPDPLRWANEAFLLLGLKQASQPTIRIGVNLPSTLSVWDFRNDHQPVLESWCRNHLPRGLVWKLVYRHPPETMWVDPAVLGCCRIGSALLSIDHKEQDMSSTQLINDLTDALCPLLESLFAVRIESSQRRQLENAVASAVGKLPFENGEILDADLLKRFAAKLEALDRRIDHLGAPQWNPSQFQSHSGRTSDI